MNANMRIYLVGVAWPSSRGLRATILNIHAIGNDVLYIFNVGLSQIQLWSAPGETGWGCGEERPLTVDDHSIQTGKMLEEFDVQYYKVNVQKMSIIQ